jgi:hypothetical protein
VLRRVVALVLLSVGLLLALELSARVMLFGRAGLDPRRVPWTRGLTPRVVQPSSEPSIGFEHIPNLDVYANLVPFRTNSRGLRDEEYPLAKPEGTFRVAVLGSSFTVPSGVAIEKAFHSHLEKRFSEIFAPTRYEFLNFARVAATPSQMLATLRHRALAYDPDLILVSVTRLAAPEFLRSASRRLFRPLGRDVDRGEAAARWDPERPRSYLLKLLELRLAKAPGTPPVPASQEPEPPGPTVLAEFGALGREKGIPIAVVRLEFNPRAPNALDQKLERRVRRQGMFYVDTRSWFEGRNPRDFWIFEFDPHPNARAHAVFAGALHDFLRRHDLL